MDDRKIIELFYERSEQAIVELSNKYGRLCQKLAKNILQNHEDAEECVSDAYLGAWNSIPPQNPDSLSTYVCGIVRHLAIKKYHANTAAKRNSVYDVALDELADCFPADGSVEETLHAAEIAHALDEFLETLTRKDRILFVRRYWYSDSISELSALFQTTPHNISVRLSRLRAKLKKHLTKKGIYV